MKYSRLTKEQFESLHEEFAAFLATQSITAEDWLQLKKDKPHVAEDMLDVFSDLIWEGVLNKAAYLDHVSPRQLFLFKIEASEMHLIVVQIEEHTIDITTDAGFEWLQTHFKDEQVSMFKASKEFSEDRNSELFKLIQQGATLSDGSFYEEIKKLM